MRPRALLHTWTLLELHGVPLRWQLTGEGAAGYEATDAVVAIRSCGPQLLVQTEDDGCYVAYGPPREGWTERIGLLGFAAREQLEGLGLDCGQYGVVWRQPPRRGVEDDLTWEVTELPDGTWVGFAAERVTSLVRFQETEPLGSLEEARDQVVQRLRDRMRSQGEDEALRILAEVRRFT